ncbi:MAG: hypothetical protein GY851_05825, partial [bacterium]|nr:hypothetical protein [bacterium]
MNTQSMLAVVSCLLAVCCVHAHAQAAPPHAIGSEPQLFVDDALLATKADVTRRAHACEKLPQPVLEPEAPWEQDGDDQRLYVYGTILRDADTGQFRMWYNRLALVLFATSDDGIHWTRPDLGIHMQDEWPGNNIVHSRSHSPSIVCVPDSQDPAHRYAMIGSGKGYWFAWSSDGLNWRNVSDVPLFTGGDTCTLAYDAKTGEYLAFHKLYRENRGHKRRLVYLSTSKDLEHWSKQVLVMAPDEVDDAQVQAEGGQFGQFYNMTAFPYGNQFLGMVTHFRYTGPPDREGPIQSSHDGPIDVQLVHSRDGRDWERCEDRSPIIPNGPHAYDAGCILGVSNTPVIVDDEMWFYYTAITTGHGGFVPEKRITIALAKWRLDGFVSLDAAETPGTVETVPLTLSGGHLTVNAKVDGALTVAVLDASGTPLPGYGHDEARVVTGDSVRHAASWKEHDTPPADTPVRLQF